jgi:NTP pyrophosphatase (non-canonical NTP hydrolase)
MDKYQEFQNLTQQKDFDLKYLALGLGGEVGEVLNEIKKLERDDDNILSNERKDKIILELGDIMWYMQGIFNKLDISLEEVLIKNMEKLQFKNNILPKISGTEITTHLASIDCENTSENKIEFEINKVPQTVSFNLDNEEINNHEMISMDLDTRQINNPELISIDSNNDNVKDNKILEVTPTAPEIEVYNSINFSKLKNMGFSDEDIQNSLENTDNNLELAINLLINT